MHRIRIVFAAFFMTASGEVSAIAQDVRPESGFSAGSVSDIAGFSSAMSGPELVTALEKHFAGRQLTQKALQRARLSQTSEPFLMSFRWETPYNSSTTSRELIHGVLSSQASGNKLVYALRELRFADNQQPDMVETVKSVLTKYGSPSAVAGNALHYIYVNGKVALDGISYDPNSVVQALANPSLHPPQLSAKYPGVDFGRCLMAAGRIRSFGEQTLQVFFNESRDLKCDAVLRIAVLPSANPGRVYILEAQMLDYKGIVTRALTDSNAAKGIEAARQKAIPIAPSPKL